MADLVGTYYGTQFMTTNNRGAEVYGGSDMTVVRGGFDALLALPLSEEVALAIDQARTYDAAASECFDGLYASRRNYDVAQGRDGAGRSGSGVLEQSWRLGGASGAEIGALEAFRADPSLRIVRATTREVYGDAPELPAGRGRLLLGRRRERRTLDQVCVDRAACRRAMNRSTCESRASTSSAR